MDRPIAVFHGHIRNIMRILQLSCLLWVGVAQAAVPLHGAWREVRDSDTPAVVMSDFYHGQLKAFDPNMLHRFPVDSWVVLDPQPPWVQEERVLTLYPPPLGTVTLYDSHGPVVALTVDDFASDAHGNGRLAFRLTDSIPAATPLLLRFSPSADVASPVGFRLQDWSEYLRQDAHWLVFASACFAVMLSMALMALCFALMLRDVTFAWYAGYILCYALIQGIQTGFAFHPLEWQWLAGGSLLIGPSAMALSVAFASLFVIRFCELQRYAAVLRTPVIALAVGMLLVVLLRCSHVAMLETVGQLLIAPLLTLGAALLLLVAGTAAFRGSRHAWFFLAGWTPLLLLTAMSSAQLSGALAGVDWLSDGGLAVGAFEAIVLSIGLADRALVIRRDRDKVRLLADKDSLTQVLNRRAWHEAALTALGKGKPRSLALLFLDLDHFKMLNDRRGHAAGDQALIAVANALRAELRPADLLGRYGGEEFVALLDGVGELQAMQVATRLCRRVHRLEIPVDEQMMTLSVSIGVALGAHGDMLDPLVEQADQAMYDAKISGRNRARLHVVGRGSAIRARNRVTRTSPVGE
jgi:diguanylate cyclase (GGDEF)-like protein